MRSLVLVGLLAACSSSVGPDGADDVDQPEGFVDGKADAPLDPSWMTVGTGVAYQQVNTGHAVLIAYGGYSAWLSYSSAWATELVDARLGAADVGHVYAVKGPADPGYDAREIANTKLRAHLRSLAEASGPIYIVAHSSGSYVAHELLEQMHAAGETALLARIAYADLDGGGSGLTEQIVGELGAIAFVYARDPTLGSGRSQNSSTAVALGNTYAGQGAKTVEVTVPSTGCGSGAGWCLHDVVITHRPHNPWSYDLARDYTDFANRPVTTEYLEALIAP
jgi:hypothetical protein